MPMPAAAAACATSRTATYRRRQPERSQFYRHGRLAHVDSKVRNREINFRFEYNKTFASITRYNMACYSFTKPHPIP
jgi:hypothetical protein